MTFQKDSDHQTAKDDLPCKKSGYMHIRPLRPFPGKSNQALNNSVQCPDRRSRAFRTCRNEPNTKRRRRVFSCQAFRFIRSEGVAETNASTSRIFSRYHEYHLFTPNGVNSFRSSDISSLVKHPFSSDSSPVHAPAYLARLILSLILKRKINYASC